MVCSPTSRLNPFRTRSPYPRYRPLHMCVPQPLTGTHTGSPGFGFCTQHCSSCGADHSGPGWARSEAQLVPIYQRALSVTAPAYPHLRNSTGARCWPGRERHHIHTSTGGAKRSSFPRGILRGQARLGAGLARENPGPPGPLLWGVASGIRSLGSVLSSVKQGWSWDPPAGLA